MPEHHMLQAAALTGWRKSSYSGAEGGSCIEVLDGYPAGVPVRDSKDSHGPAVVFPAAAWRVFVAAVKGSATV
ncbi:DUF397 domain-containing protein [Streptomyces lydicus]|uniref:DUF397 domain-containing protein n=1 Tax=Streptomyces lydicus TaxID=47763 RepID=A0A1D7VVZ5_9ACTN|nr:DUF397 domain-containing protein [Streptomyces lydicus]AOP50668.1 DUF397 domain-containing protein [Streptomyces lydicus]